MNLIESIQLVAKFQLSDRLFKRMKHIWVVVQGENHQRWETRGCRLLFHLHSNR
eukprot:m.28329 g.28329  ORF g.28329 m.28329 type:complete len:54 (+) comp12007_c1_seq1:1-162(+)